MHGKTDSGVVDFAIFILQLNSLLKRFYYISREAQLRRNVYHSRPSVCLSVPRRIPTLLHGPGCKLGNGRGALQLCTHYWADLQSVHEFRCYDNSAEREKSSSACILALCLVILGLFVFCKWKRKPVLHFTPCIMLDGQLQNRLCQISSVFIIQCAKIIQNLFIFMELFKTEGGLWDIKYRNISPD